MGNPVPRITLNDLPLILTLDDEDIVVKLFPGEDAEGNPRGVAIQVLHNASQVPDDRGDDEWDVWVSDTVWIDKLERAGWKPVAVSSAGGTGASGCLETL